MARASQAIIQLFMVNVTPRSRLARGPFLLLSLAWFAIFLTFITWWRHSAPTAAQRSGLLEWLTMTCFWPTFCITARRLHDRGLSSWLAAPHLIPLIATLLVILLTPAWPRILGWLINHRLLNVEMSVITGTLALPMAYVALAFIVLCILPGQRVANRYGPPPSRPDGAPDVF